MTKCRWDNEAGEYIADGEPCKTDDYGDPTHHCKARRTCSVHIAANELTCPRCIGRTRADIAWVQNLAALMSVEALNRGVASEAANIAGPAGDPLVLSWRRVNQATETTTIGDGIEETAPVEVLGIWQAMIAEDYGHELPDRITLGTAAAYLDRHLARIANDPGQDFPLMAREIRKSRTYLETVLRNSSRAERGAPCPDCTSEETGVGPRLVREYAHWCEDADCERMHYADDSEDRWVCPRDRGHWWNVEDYDRWVAERKGA